MASAIPPALRKEIEQDTQCVIVSERPRGGGGASRQGAEVILRSSSGIDRHCYLAWDNRAGDPSRLPYFLRETEILKALSGPFLGSGVKVAQLIGAYPSHLALLSDFVPGADRFSVAKNKQALAIDFVGQLAALHRIDAFDSAFRHLGDPHEPQASRVQENLAEWQQLSLSAGADPVLQLALTWLRRNVPENLGPTVVLHGDAGPGNFIHHDDCVAALVDWELCHLGDPMEDLAQIWVRSLIQPFVPIAEVFAAYEAASGFSVDLARVKFFRLYFQLSFSVASAVSARTTDSHASASGTGLLFGTMHKRVIVRSVAELAGVAVSDPEIPILKPDSTDRLFLAALDDLKNEIAPIISDQRASAKAKELARLVKFWRRRATYGAAFDAAELAEIKRLIPSASAELSSARAQFARAIVDGAVDFADAVQLCHNRVTRETFVMAEAMGTLATTWYEETD